MAENRLRPEPARPCRLSDDDPASGSVASRRAVLSLGSNLDDRADYLRRGVGGLKSLPETVVVAVSPVYETVAVGEPQPDFLNLVVLADTSLSPTALLAHTQSIEVSCGRPRNHLPGARTLDIDLVVIGDEIVSTETLSVPHPRAHERAFVLCPWLDVDPLAFLPGHGPVAELAAAVLGASHLNPQSARPHEPARGRSPQSGLSGIRRHEEVIDA